MRASASRLREKEVLELINERESAGIGAETRMAWASAIAWMVLAVWAAGSGLAAMGCEREVALSLRAVVLESPASEDPFDLEEPFALARGEACEACAQREVALPAGDVVRVRLPGEPAFELEGDAIAGIELVEEGDAKVLRPAVHAIVAESARADWEAFAARHARAHLLVELDGEVVDLIRPLAATRTIRIGIFASEAARAAYVAGLPFEVRSGALRPSSDPPQGGPER